MDFEIAKKEFSRWFVVKKYDELYISIDEDNGGNIYKWLLFKWC